MEQAGLASQHDGLPNAAQLNDRHQLIWCPSFGLLGPRVLIQSRQAKPACLVSNQPSWQVLG